MKLFTKYIAAALMLFGFAVTYMSCEKSANFKMYTYPDHTDSGLAPGRGYPTTDVVITGNNFGTLTGAVKVYFGGVLADTVRSCTDNKIIVQVPLKAVSGKVSLSVWTHANDSIGTFTVIPIPLAKSVSPDAGSPGDVITLKGTGFGTDISKLTISFNGTAGVINTVVADTLITATVPANFSSGNIVLTVNGFPVTGPSFAYLVPVPTAMYQLNFENNLNEANGGTAATYIQGTGSAISYVTGISGQAVYLPGYANASGGINQTISLPANTSKYNELTVACWVNWLGQRIQEPLFDFGETRGNRVCWMATMPASWNGAGTNTVGRVIFENKTGFTGYNEYNLITGKTIKTGEWHHIAMTVSYASHEMRMYYDGILIGTKTLPNAAALTLFSHNRVYIGGPAYGVANEPAYGGGIDKFQIYNSVLSANQVYTLFYKK